MIAAAMCGGSCRTARHRPYRQGVDHGMQQLEMTDCQLSLVCQGCIVLALVFGISTCSWLPLEAQDVIQNGTIPIQCVAQNYAQMVTTRCVSDLKDTADRNANMFAGNTVRCLVPFAT